MNTKNYEMTEETVSAWNGETLHRIRATASIKNHGVRKGDLGGFIGKAVTLSDNAWVSGDAKVSGNANIFGNARVSGNATVYDDAMVSGNADVFGNAMISGNADIFGNARLFNTAWVGGDARVFDDAEVTGNVKVSGNAMVSDNAKLSGNAMVSGNAKVYCNAEVTGNAMVSGNVTLAGDAIVYGDAMLTGDARVYGEAEVFDRDHVFTSGPFGFNEITITAFRTKSGHAVQAGCEKCTADTLMDVVARRKPRWDHHQKAAQWEAEYAAVSELMKVRVASWHDEEEA